MTKIQNKILSLSLSVTEEVWMNITGELVIIFVISYAYFQILS